jgi:hypothetical protein
MLPKLSESRRHPYYNKANRRNNCFPANYIAESLENQKITMVANAIALAGGLKPSWILERCCQKNEIRITINDQCRQKCERNVNKEEESDSSGFAV